MVKEMGWKPIVNTNGLALNESLLKELKQAAVFGFTFHIDTSQKRPKVHADSEEELNELRLYYARMLARVGDNSCSFNATISEKTLHEIPDMTRWAEKHDRYRSHHGVYFISFSKPVGKFRFLRKRKKNSP